MGFNPNIPIKECVNDMMWVPAGCRSGNHVELMCCNGTLHHNYRETDQKLNQVEPPWMHRIEGRKLSHTLLCLKMVEEAFPLTYLHPLCVYVCLHLHMLKCVCCSVGSFIHADPVCVRSLHFPGPLCGVLIEFSIGRDGSMGGCGYAWPDPYYWSQVRCMNIPDRLSE